MFTYNDWSAGTEYDYMVKAAVTSGIEVARMKPYCMYSGSTSAEMYQWFLSKGVTIIQASRGGDDVMVQSGWCTCLQLRLAPHHRFNQSVLVQHEPAWRDALVKEGARNKELNLVHSHLYKTGGTLVGTFQRIDIPILRQFDQYNYVLFTGVPLVPLLALASPCCRPSICCRHAHCSCRLRRVLPPANEARRLGHAPA